MSCPNCNRDTDWPTTNVFRCYTCGHTEPREDIDILRTNVRDPHGLRGEPSYDTPPENSLGSIERFFELRKQDPQSALIYIEFARFEGRDDLNRHYHAAKLAVELGDEPEAKKHLELCRKYAVMAEHPERIEALAQQVFNKFGA